ncbi:6-aminohexanoate-cyclic-dimer hydrolase [compost metagenome]
MQLHEYTSFDGLGLSQLVRDGAVSAAELHDAAVRACTAVNPHINAVVELWPADFTHIDHTAPFAGVPFLIKDVAVTMAGKLSEAGSRLGAGHVAALDSHLMTQFRQAGLITFGRTSTPEMAFATTTEPVLYGATRNPWNVALSAGRFQRWRCGGRRGRHRAAGTCDGCGRIHPRACRVDGVVRLEAEPRPGLERPRHGRNLQRPGRAAGREPHRARQRRLA